jgi:hypothetical protein
MATLFRRAAATAAAVIDRVFGEPFLLRPMALVGGKWVSDPARASVSLTAVLTEKQAFSDPIGERGGSGMSKDVASQHATSFSTIEIEKAAAPYQISAKDRFTRIETGDAYEVSGAPKTDLDHIVLRVVRIGKP